MKLSFLGLVVLLAGVPGVGRTQDMDANYQSLKDADAKGDTATVKKLAGETYAIAAKAAAEPAPEAADDKDAWTKRVEYAHSVESFCDYALYSAALKSQPAGMVEMLAALEAQDPKSKYLDDGYASYLYALSQSGATAKIPAVAEKALANFPENPDLLSVLAENAYAAGQGARAQGFANRLVAAAGKRARPEGMAEADFQKRKASWLGSGYFISGDVAGTGNQYAAADKNLRAALPYIQGNTGRMARAYFYLGVANYNLGKMTMNKAKVLEGAKFSDQCAAITGPLAQQCWTNSANIKKEAGTMR